MVKPYNKDGFENRITNNLNTMLIVSENPNIESNEQAIVKYYSFELDIEENVNPKEEKKMYDKEKKDNRESNTVEKERNLVKNR
ncbi:hypothetical protein F8M41_020135 [Gigaspora margarita]|uniref:Uncharacterized protein n=1 Tax=Gigaspora margarita TaxID=4874 RepID=A0A8H3WTD5_GIGMA|nr:hypothetical protein F8M41_020135 [Gigaspora margarita]